MPGVTRRVYYKGLPDKPPLIPPSAHQSRILGTHQPIIYPQTENINSRDASSTSTSFVCLPRGLISNDDGHNFGRNRPIPRNHPANNALIDDDWVGLDDFLRKSGDRVSRFTLELNLQLDKRR
ncbi:hypothetical protein KEM48_014429 [Puccinia striiformis f. sp. tritici PST-130]|nr:hypothetical protein KEM48_014429 [Puccinia striiformis f. sp. tritici PST-130]